VVEPPIKDLLIRDLKRLVRRGVALQPAVQHEGGGTRAVSVDTKTWSLKRLAWAFGCAKADSPEELELEKALRLRLDVVNGHYRTECCLAPWMRRPDISDHPATGCCVRCGKMVDR
jgi:hypothetical protein